jgi:hypothetical protein
MTATRVPATATFNRATGALWVTHADGHTEPVPAPWPVSNEFAAATALHRIGAVRLSDWGLVATKSPLRQARIELPA